MTKHEPQFGATETCHARLDFDTAQAILSAYALPLGKERVPLSKAGRRRLAEPVLAQIDSPRWDTAAMDGYAIRSAEWQGGRRQYAVAATSLAGDSRIGSVPADCAVRIMTGAPMPPGLDQVAVLEKCTVSGDMVGIADHVAAKPHVRAARGDFASGDTLLAAGRVIDPRAMAVAAAADTADLTVWRRPRVACLASGDELVGPGLAHARGSAIPDCLGEAVQLLARQWSAKPIASRRVADDLSEVTSAARVLLDQSDVLVMIGGAARGDRDYAKAALASLGLSIAFSDVAIKPGKPVWYGQIGAKHVLGLPGNPTAAMTTARLFLAPLLAALSGSPSTPLTFEWLPLATSFDLACDREQFLCASREDCAAHIIERQSASMQSTLADADLLVRLPPGRAVLPAGTLVQAIRF